MSDREDRDAEHEDDGDVFCDNSKQPIGTEDPPCPGPATGTMLTMAALVRGFGMQNGLDQDLSQHSFVVELLCI